MSAATLDELLDSVEAAFERHDLWCGHKADAPGDGSFNEAARALEELRTRLTPTAIWPPLTFAAALEAFGPAIYNTASRTHQALDRRIRHALRTWEEKYGANGEQLQYADTVLAHAITKAAEEAGGATAKLWPYTQAGIGRVVHHDRVIEGMRKRAGYVDPATILNQLS